MPATAARKPRTPAIPPELFARLRAADREELADAATAAVQALRPLLRADDSRTVLAAAGLIFRLQMAAMRHGWPPELGGPDRANPERGRESDRSCPLPGGERVAGETKSSTPGEGASSTRPPPHPPRRGAPRHPLPQGRG